MRIPAEPRPAPRIAARARTAAVAAVVTMMVVLASAPILAGCGSSGSSNGGASIEDGAVRHFESGPTVARITGDLEAIGRACAVAGGPAALRAADDLGTLIDAGPRDTYGPANANQTLAQLGRVVARRASCARLPNLRAELLRLGTR